MSCTDDTASARSAIVSALGNPASVTTDGMTVQGRSITELIAAHKYLSGVCAAKTPTRGLRFNRLIPDGTVRGRPFAPGVGGLWGYGFDRWRDV